MSTNIGSAITGLSSFNVNTLMPDLTDTADIQEALRLYHYGAPSGTGVGQYDPTNTNPANLKNPSIAYALYSLQTQITTLQGVSGVPGTAYTAKGVILVGTGISAYSAVTVGTNGQVLTANSATASGVQWATPSVTDINTVTLTNKTLTAPKITASSFIADTNGNAIIALPALVTTPVNYLTISNTATTIAPTISATGTDTNIGINLIPKGTGTVQVNGLPIVSTTGTQTLTNKTLTSPTINAPTVTQLYLSDSVVVFEGATNDAFETTLGVIDPTATRTINLPNVSGTIITSGNLSDITAVGTITSGTFPAANLSGTSLPAAITGSSLTSLGTVTSGTFPAANLSGTTLASNVISSSLTSVGTLSSLTISGDLTVNGRMLERISINPQVANYIIVASDDSKMIEMNVASANTITLPNLSTVPVGAKINILQTGTGQTTVVAGTNVTINATPGLKLRTQWSSATLIKRVTAATDVWVLVGDIVA